MTENNQFQRNIAQTILNNTVQIGREAKNIYDIPEALSNQRMVSPRELTPNAAKYLSEAK